MAATKKVPRKRRPQERAEVTKRTLITVALKEFSERGYDAVTVRDIETLAGVQRNLVRYHFGSKEELWKAAAGFNIEQLQKFTERRGEMMRDIESKHGRISYIIRSFVRFCAKHPELNSLLLEEGTQDSWRIEWLVQNHVKRAMLGLRELVKSDLGLSDEEFINWYYIMIGGGAMIFSVAPEAKLMFGTDTKSSKVVDRHADMLTAMLMMKMQAPPN
ncbi:TetR/AcrR family transcriptional regulator [Sphingorhabdus sp. SMR4y]|uniref:TetR/AcrR family transcriptional regulator n=1 Tax=Sphingorhabdus sp. SMR4y TaxID=2584094 RepID=UPI000B613ACD|nr:TetR/AcrR family transcriptional regulator [Sphingorhabdus sp. SMR4y]ASK89699.1 putative DNA-binding transcriptional regulator [Sphingorhabdus sp. SMR4y]